MQGTRLTALLVSVFLFVPLALAAVYCVAAPADRRYLTTLVLVGWLLVGSLTTLVNDWAPFSGGGDDEDYFRLASQPHRSLSELLDISRFQGVMEQPGYPWLLSILNLVVEPDLLAYKLANLLVLTLVALTWYRIGFVLGDRGLGRAMAVGTLMLTPLWFYVFVLRKDLVVVLLQSLFLLGLVQQWKQNRWGAWLLVSTATLLLLPFRTPLVLQNAAVATGSVILASSGPGRSKRRLWSLLLAIPVIVGLLAAAADLSILQSFGVFTEHRVVGSEAMWRTALESGEASTMKRALFPFTYLFSDTSGLNPQTWIEFRPESLRGALALPWIFLVVPMFLRGIRWLAKRPIDTRRSSGLFGSLRDSRFMATPWAVLSIFVLSSVAISWTVGDATRWRLPDMPVILAIAVAARYYGSPGVNTRTVALWSASLIVLFSAYALRGGL